MRWVRKSAEQGYAKAQSYMGLFYGMGYGVRTDADEAERWLRLACGNGSRESCYVLDEVRKGLRR